MSAPRSAYDYLPEGFSSPMMGLGPLPFPNMSAVSLTQPWASAVAEGHKRYETRTWAITAVRLGTIALHATARPDKEFCDSVRPMFGDDYTFPTSAIIGLIHVTECHKTNSLKMPMTLEERVKEYGLGDFSEGRYAWEISRVLRFDDPIRTGGALSLWRVPDDVEEQLVHRLYREDYTIIEH